MAVAQAARTSVKNLIHPGEQQQSQFGDAGFASSRNHTGNYDCMKTSIKQAAALLQI